MMVVAMMFIYTYTACSISVSWCVCSNYDTCTELFVMRRLQTQPLDNDTDQELNIITERLPLMWILWHTP